VTATVATERAWYVVVPHHPRGARIARHHMAEALTGRVSPQRLADVVAIAAELVGNAVRHATPLPGGVIRLEFRLSAGGGLVVIVTDGGSANVPVIRPPSTASLDGRGLAIVAALANSWGVDRGEREQNVWATLS
jgi:anti-sigma regulatory factor (Ser/Thr protein kinase)